jgi:hypothetical protein
MASLPKHLMTRANITTNTTIGIADTHAAGWRNVLFFLNFGIYQPIFIQVKAQI